MLSAVSEPKDKSCLNCSARSKLTFKLLEIARVIIVPPISKLRFKTGRPLSTTDKLEVVAPKSTSIMTDLSLPTKERLKAKFSVSKLSRVKPAALNISTYLFTKSRLAPVKSIFEFFWGLEKIFLIDLASWLEL